MRGTTSSYNQASIGQCPVRAETVRNTYDTRTKHFEDKLIESASPILRGISYLIPYTLYIARIWYVHTSLPVSVLALTTYVLLCYSVVLFQRCMNSELARSTARPLLLVLYCQV